MTVKTLYEASHQKSHPISEQQDSYQKFCKGTTDLSESYHESEHASCNDKKSAKNKVGKTVFQHTELSTELSPALAYHIFPIPGKFSTQPSKKLSCATDLSLAYSPGVAEACQKIALNPDDAFLYTMRQHLVAVISNGTAVLGLGNIGPLASKPVMEGKAVLFQLFSGLNAIDLEINEQDPEKLIEIIASLAPSFGAINLEDIKAPECFRVESVLKERLNIPVFHDDQHGTAIIVASAITNALELVGKTLHTSRCVVSGAGAGALACVRLLVELGMPRENITLCDTKGVIHSERTDLSSYKTVYARSTWHRSLYDAIEGADIVLGLSGPASVTQDMIARMADRPIVFALANPIPEIWPHEVLQVRPDAYVGTGRSDLPNQVNNVLCFPYIFRGAMDAGAARITLPMKKACVYALSRLAKEGFVDLTGSYGGEIKDFGPEYFIPKAFDLRLGVDLPLAVAKIAIESGEAQAFDLDYYRSCLIHRSYQNFLFFKTLLARVRCNKKKIPSLGYAIETKNNRIPNAVLAAARILKTYGLAQPYFIGNPEAISDQLKQDSVLAHTPVYALPENFRASDFEIQDEDILLSFDEVDDFCNNPITLEERSFNESEDQKISSESFTGFTGPYIRVVSENIHPHQSAVQGWLYKDQLHLYAAEKVSPWMQRILETCGCFFVESVDQSSSIYDSGMLDSHQNDVVHRPEIDNPTKNSQQWMTQPHFGGLAYKKPLETFWHIDTPPKLLGVPWFGPILLCPKTMPCISEKDDVRCGMEYSAWALLMQETSVW